MQFPFSSLGMSTNPLVICSSILSLCLFISSESFPFLLSVASFWVILMTSWISLILSFKSFTYSFFSSPGVTSSRMVSSSSFSFSQLSRVPLAGFLKSPKSASYGDLPVILLTVVLITYCAIGISFSHSSLFFTRSAATLMCLTTSWFVLSTIPFACGWYAST
ncbi:hypothetical protein ADUPG1_001813, partial [Aduncisulcus paluster]